MSELETSASELSRCEGGGPTHPQAAAKSNEVSQPQHPQRKDKGKKVDEAEKRLLSSTSASTETNSAFDPRGDHGPGQTDASMLALPPSTTVTTLYQVFIRPSMLIPLSLTLALCTEPGTCFSTPQYQNP